jgi:hypothetical protein
VSRLCFLSPFGHVFLDRSKCKAPDPEFRPGRAGILSGMRRQIVSSLPARRVALWPTEKAFSLPCSQPADSVL